MDNTKIINKPTFYAAEMAGIVKPYAKMSASEMFGHVMKHECGFTTDAEFMNIVNTRFPERIAAEFTDSKGNRGLKAFKPAEYFEPGSQQAGSTIKGTGVVPFLIADVIMEGASPFVCARDTLTVYKMKSEFMNVPFYTPRGNFSTAHTNAYVPVVGANGEAYDLNQRVAHAMLTAKRHSLKSTIGNELLNDADIDIMAMNLREMGATMEMELNQEVYSKMLAFAPAANLQTVDGTTVTEIKAVFGADAAVKKNGFRTSDCVVWPGFKAGLMNSLAPFYNETAMAESEFSHKISYGNLLFSDLAIVPDGGLYTGSGVAYPTANNFGALVYDRSRCGALGIREDMEMEMFDDIPRYAKVPVMTTRFAYVNAVDDNTATITNALAVAAIIHS